MRQEDTALADLSYATERWPKIWDTWVWRGDFYFRRERWSDAISDYSNGLALNPNYWSAWYWRGVASVRLSEWDRAVHDYAKAIALQPNSASLHNELARLLATCPDQKIRDPKRAVDLARSAVEREPENGMYRNTLGVSLYRLGDYQGAVDELSRSVELREGGDAFDGFFLGMSHWHLGHQDEARKWYDKAVEWMDKNQPKNEELRRFRAESAELLGVKEK